MAAAGFSLRRMCPLLSIIANYDSIHAAGANLLRCLSSAMLSVTAEIFG